jgi:DNA-directed RNA polymerase specialized sigma24 family protein
VTDLATASEAVLLGLMSRQASEPELARAAWEQLYQRHVRYVFVVVSRSYSVLLAGEGGVADVVVDTFRRAYEWTGRQPSSAVVVGRFHETDPDRTRRRVLGWLTAIAERVLKDRLRGRAESLEELRFEVPDPRIADSITNPANLTELGERLVAALATLRPEDAEALRVSLPWYDSEAGCFAFPRGEAAVVAATLGITAELLRQRRHRALKLLETQLRESPALALDQRDKS